MKTSFSYYLIISAFLTVLLTGVSFGQTDSVTYRHLQVRSVPVDVIYVDLKDPRIVVTPVVSENFPKKPENFESIVSREAPIAAINGNFFCKQTYKPIGDIVIDGNLVHFGGLGTAMAVTRDNNVEFITVDRYRHMDWKKYKTVISCGPKLMENGNIELNPAAEGFKDPNIYAARNRSAVGVTDDRRLLLVAVNADIYFEDLARIMKDLGCRDAMNLDGGSSSALYYKGETILIPKTAMPDILVIQYAELQPSVLVSLKDRAIKGEKRIEIFSSVDIVINSEKVLVKELKGDKVLLVMNFDNPRSIEAPEWGAKIDTSDNKITIKFPLEKLRELLDQNNRIG